MTNDGALAEFAKGLRGLVIAHNHPDYQEARKLYNAVGCCAATGRSMTGQAMPRMRLVTSRSATRNRR